MNCDIGSEKAIVDELLTINGVTFAYRTHGVYDMVIKLELPSQDELRNALIKIRKIDVVHSSLTLMVTEKG